MQAEQSILDRIQRRQLKWYGNLLRMQDSRWPKKIYQWTPHGRKRRRRSQQSWMNQLRTSWEVETWKKIWQKIAKSRPSTPKRQRCLSSTISSSMPLLLMKSVTWFLHDSCGLHHLLLLLLPCSIFSFWFFLRVMGCWPNASPPTWRTR